jgi:hypothetical protein
MTTYIDIGVVDETDDNPSGATVELAYVPDIDEQALAVTKSRLRNAPRIRALITALAAGAQLQEDLNFALIVDRHIDTAAGAALDQWGTLAGELRQGATDRDYRRYLKGRIYANVSQGYVNDLLRMWDILTGPNVRVFHMALFPRAIKLYVVRSTWMSDVRAARVARIMEDARPMGTDLALIEAVTGYYGFAEDPEASGFGFGRWAREIS